MKWHDTKTRASRQKVVEAVRALTDGATVHQVVDATGLCERTVRRRLGEATRAGTLTRTEGRPGGSSRRGRPPSVWSVA